MYALYVSLFMFPSLCFVLFSNWFVRPYVAVVAVLVVTGVGVFIRSSDVRITGVVYQIKHVTWSE